MYKSKAQPLVKAVRRTRAVAAKNPAPLFEEYKANQLERLDQAIELAGQRWGDSDKGLTPRPYSKEETRKMKAQDGKCFRVVKYGNPDYEGINGKGLAWIEGRSSIDDRTRSISMAWLGQADPDLEGDGEDANPPDEVEIRIQVGQKNWECFLDANGEPSDKLSLWGYQVLDELKNLRGWIEGLDKTDNDGASFLQLAIDARSNPRYGYEGYDAEEGYMWKANKSGEKSIDGGNKLLSGARGRWEACK